MGQEKTINSYSEQFKLFIIGEVEKGYSINSMGIRYGIGGRSTIQKWIKKYGRNHLFRRLLFKTN